MLVSGEHVGVVMGLEGWGVGQGGGWWGWLWLGGYLQFYTWTFTYTDIYPPHYENTPIQIYRNVHLQKPKIFR